MSTTWKEFYEKAALLGHDLTTLEQGSEELRYFTFPTLEEGRKLLSVADDRQRILRQQSFFNAPIAARQRLGQGKHDRGEAILFANGAFNDGDEQGVNNHLPARIKAVSVLEKRIPAGETWDISVRGSAWDIDDMEELYTTVNVGRLILEPGAKVIVQGNVCSLLCQELIILPGATDNVAEDFHIGILPTPFSVDLKNGPMNGPDGSLGIKGLNGADGIAAQVTSSMLGYLLIKEIDPEEMNGKPGMDGTDGLPGTDGRNGGMCKIAELTIRSLEGQLNLFTQAGQGGDGGHGGHGADGGNGGNGTPGHKLMTSILHAGQGGNGGHGSHGAKGGNGGHGGLSSNIYIDVLAADEHKVHCLSLPSSGGLSGDGGKAGNGGAGGLNGGGDYATADGLKGNDGLEGKPGKDGRSRPAAYIFLNEKCVQGEVPDATAGILLQTT